MKRILSLTLLLMLVLAGCRYTSQLHIVHPDVVYLSDSLVKDPGVFETTPPETTVPGLDIESGTYQLTHTDELTGNYLDYYLYIPENAVENMPLFIFLHGDGEVGKLSELENYGMIKQARQYFGEEFPFIAIQPCTRVPSWYDQGVPETLKSLIDTVVSNYAIDPDRIILTGHSRGAIGTWYMVNTYVDYFAAAVPVSCGSHMEIDPENFKHVPIFAICGDGDPHEQAYSYAMRQHVKSINDAGGCAELIILEGVAHIESVEDAYSEATFIWMLQQRKEPSQ